MSSLWLIIIEQNIVVNSGLNHHWLSGLYSNLIEETWIFKRMCSFLSFSSTFQFLCKLAKCDSFRLDIQIYYHVSLSVHVWMFLSSYVSLGLRLWEDFFVSSLKVMCSWKSILRQMRQEGENTLTLSGWPRSLPMIWCVMRYIAHAQKAKWNMAWGRQCTRLQYLLLFCICSTVLLEHMRIEKVH